MIRLFMDPWDYPLVSLLTCVGNSTFVVNFFFLASEIRDNWLAYSEKIYIWNIEFPNSTNCFLQSCTMSSFNVKLPSSRNQWRPFPLNGQLKRKLLGLIVV